MEFLLVLLVLAVAVLLITGPLRRVEVAEERESAERDRLAAAREAKYREIRELELDYRTGKLSREDYRAQDAARRAEAVEILRALDELDASSGPQARPRLQVGPPSRAEVQAQVGTHPGQGPQPDAARQAAAGSPVQAGRQAAAGSPVQAGRQAAAARPAVASASAKPSNGARLDVGRKDVAPRSGGPERVES